MFYFQNDRFGRPVLTFCNCPKFGLLMLPGLRASGYQTSTFFPPLILHSALHLANQIRLSDKNKTLGASISNQCLNVQP